MQPLRVCHVASGDLWAGAEIQITGLLKELKDFPDVALSAVALNRGRLSGELDRLGIPVTVYDERRLNAVQILKSLRAYFREWLPDVVHTHRYKENILAGIAARDCGVPSVIQTVHGLQENLTGWKWAKMALYSMANTIIARRTAHGVIGVSGEIADIMRRRFPKSEVLCIHNGIDVNQVRPSVSARAKRKELCIPEHTLVIGTVCRLAPVKGIEYLLKAVSRYRKYREVEAIRLLIVGDGPSRAKLEALVTELGIGHETLFLGMRDDVYDLMNLVDIYVLPSLHEGIPMALLEAMALERPVVATRVGGIPEIVEDMVEGKLVHPQDIDGLADAIRAMACSWELREQLGKAGRERIIRTYNSHRMASLVRQLYKRSVDRHTTEYHA